jgi:hypothetical protein
VTPKFGVVSFRESPSVKGWVVGCGLWVGVGFLIL